MPTTKYIWDDENVLAEADASDTINVVYTNEPQEYGNLVSTRISGTTSYHHFDALGSTRQLTNAAGTTTDTVVYTLGAMSLLARARRAFHCCGSASSATTATLKLDLFIVECGHTRRRHRAGRQPTRLFSLRALDSMHMH